MARFLDEAGITEDDILYAEVNEMNGNDHDPIGTTDMVPYVSPLDGIVREREIMVDQYGRYVFK